MACLLLLLPSSSFFLVYSFLSSCLSPSLEVISDFPSVCGVQAERIERKKEEQDLFFLLFKKYVFLSLFFVFWSSKALGGGKMVFVSFSFPQVLQQFSMFNKCTSCSHHYSCTIYPILSLLVSHKVKNVGSKKFSSLFNARFWPAKTRVVGPTWLIFNHIVTCWLNQN